MCDRYSVIGAKKYKKIVLKCLVLKRVAFYIFFLLFFQAHGSFTSWQCSRFGAKKSQLYFCNSRYAKIKAGVVWFQTHYLWNTESSIPILALNLI